MGIAVQAPPTALYSQVPWPAVAALAVTSTPPRLAPLSTSPKRPPNRVATVGPVVGLASSPRVSSLADDERVGRSFTPVTAMVTVWLAPPAVVTEKVSNTVWPALRL